MERAEAKGLGIAVAGHAVLLVALTFSLRPTDNPPAPPPSVEVTFVEEVGLQAAAPSPAAEPPAPSVAPELGPPEEAAPAPEPQPTPAPPEPAPAPPTPAPPPPRPAPQPRQEAPAPPRPQRAQPQRPQPPAAQPQRQQPPAAQPQRQQPPAAQPQRAQPNQRATPAPSPPAQRGGTQTADRSRGSRLGPDLLRGIGDDPSPSRTPTPPSAIPGEARASINAAIRRALLPCERQPLPAPAAAEIKVDVRVTLRRDGSLASADVVRVRNDDPALNMYEQRMSDLALAIVRSCTPIRGLPADYYDAPRGWRQFTYQFDPRQS